MILGCRLQKYCSWAPCELLTLIEEVLAPAEEAELLAGWELLPVLGIPVEVAAGNPVEVAAGIPVEIAAGIPVEIAAGIPVEIAAEILVAAVVFHLVVVDAGPRSRGSGH